MTLLMRDQENVAKGEEKGEEKMLILIQKLIADKRMEDISKVQESKSYRQKLYKEYYIN